MVCGTVLAFAVICDCLVTWALVAGLELVRQAAWRPGAIGVVSSDDWWHCAGGCCDLVIARYLGSGGGALTRSSSCLVAGGGGGGLIGTVSSRWFVALS